MIHGRFDPAEFLSARGSYQPTRWYLNGVPLNVRTGLLAVVMLAGIMLAASVSYRLFSGGTTDMTVPPGYSAPSRDEERSDPQPPPDLPQ